MKQKLAEVSTSSTEIVKAWQKAQKYPEEYDNYRQNSWMYSKNFTHMKNFFSTKCIVNHIDTHMNRKLLTIYRMNEACWFQCNKKYQQQCYSTRAFAKSPCYCSNNQYFGFFTLCNVNATEIMARDRDNIPRITKLTLWNHCCYSFLLTIIISCHLGTRKKQCQLIRKQLSYKGIETVQPKWIHAASEIK